MKRILLLATMITADVFAVERKELMPLIEEASIKRESSYVEIRDKIVQYGTNAIPILESVAIDVTIPWQQQLVARICYERIERGKEIRKLLETDWYSHPKINPEWPPIIIGPEPYIADLVHADMKEAGLWYYCLELEWKMTGEKVLGAGDASGVFPLDSATCDYHAGMLIKFDEHIAARGMPWSLRNILPRVLSAGEEAGKLTEAGARLLDPEGDLQAGIPLCPPEGDAGTGMVATNSVGRRTGNVSAGTSVFAMIVLEKELSKLHMEIDMVTTPAGAPVAMAHANSCTSDLNAWVGLFGEAAAALGLTVDTDRLFGTLYQKALEGDPDCGGLVAYNYFAGEPVTGLEEGRPLFLRLPDSAFTLANFMRTHLFAALATLKLGMDILLIEEKVGIDQIYGHGGLFKTKGVGQRMMAAALNTPVSVLETAGEGGAWGMALLAAYMWQKNPDETLEAYLSNRVFAHMTGETLHPDPADVAGFAVYMDRYVACLPVEKAAVAGLQYTVGRED